MYDLLKADGLIREVFLLSIGHLRGCALRKSFVEITALLLVLALLAGCYSVPQDASDPSQSRATEAIGYSERENHSAPRENLWINDSFQADPERNGVYLAGKAVRYYDLASGQITVLCNQVGCLHEDRSCTAWQGNTLRFGAYRGLWYAAVKNEDGSVSLNRTDPNTNSRKELYRWKPEELETIDVWEMAFSYGRLHVVCERTINDSPQSSEEALTWEEKPRVFQTVSVDLTSEETQVLEPLREKASPVWVQFFGASERKLFLLCTYYDEPFLQQASFYELHQELKPEELSEAYKTYTEEYRLKMKRELRCYDLNTWEYRLEASEKLAEMENTCFDDDTVFYWTFDTKNHNECHVYAIDLHKEETTELLQMDGIANIILCDGKLSLYIFSPERKDKAIYRFYWMDKGGGELHELVSHRDEGAIKFTPKQETDDYLIGTLYGSRAFIRKSDYYSDNLDKASPLN